MSKLDPKQKDVDSAIKKIRKTPRKPSSTIAKKTTRKSPRRKATPKKTTSIKVYLNRVKWISIIVGLLGIGIWFGIHFKEGIQYLLKDDSKGNVHKSLYDVRTVEVLSRHQEMMVGFDVSHYQGVIDWQSIDSIASMKPLEFVFIRATMGVDGVDKAFKLNWKGARSNHFIRGAYHYYRPDENSMQQAKNFINNVKLSEGDLPPVLDIEDLPKNQSMDSLRSGLQRWISTVEKHYKVKPILYSGEHYYTKNLKKWFPDHILWIANYNFFVEKIKPDWHFWQFSEKGIIPGIDTKVDLNIYQGTKAQIRTMLIK